MKTTLYFTLTLLTFVTLVFSSNSFAQVGSPEYVVRVIYFLPSDRTPQPDINEKLDKLIKDTQLFYAEQMTAHGFGTKTFQFEADTAGRVVVHRLNGQFNDAYYNSGTWSKVWQEIEGQFDLSNNIYLVLLDTSTELINNYSCGQGGGSSLRGGALMPASGSCFSVGLAAHELGQAFGLQHDYRTNGRWAPSAYISNGDIAHRMIRSFCSAEWLDVHRYFEINQILSTDQRIAVDTLDPSLTSPSPSAPSEMTHLCGVGAFDGHEYFKVNETVPGDAPPTFAMLGPPSLAAAPNAIRFRFRVTDPDGIHQVQLYTTESWFPHIAGGFTACKQVSGTSATVEFVTTELSPRSESVWLVVIDVRGNFIWSESYPINVSTLLPPATTVSIPDAQLAAAIREEIGDITTHSLLGLITIYASNHTGITNLTGLEYAHNLKYLNVDEGEITDLRPLANLTGLIILGLRGHQIRDISTLQNLTNLIILSLISNQISDITALGNLTNLTDLVLGYNDFSDITALGNLTNLKNLFLAGNQISDITALSDLTNLEELFLGNNNLNDITALGNLTNLTKLSLLSNQITDVGPLVSLVNLEELYLAGNPIEDFSPLRTLLANNPNLKIDIDIPDPSPLAFSPSTIADQTFTAGEAVNLTLPVATGGTPPYTYTLTPLPGGLSFKTTERVLSGTPTTEGTTTATYTATDAASVAASLTFTIRVTDPPPAPITFNPSTVADQTFTVDTPITPVALPLATGGTAPYTYTLSPIPAGLQFDSTTRKLSGTPTTPGTTDTTYTTTDTSQQTASLTFTITVAAPITFRPTEVANQTFTVGTQIQPLRLPVAAGGTAPYTYSLSPIPAGLLFDTTRLLSGTPTTAAPATPITYTARDAAGGSASLTFTITVVAPITFRPTEVANQMFTVGTQIQPLRLPVAAGGTAPYTYSLSPTPAGLLFDTTTRLLSGTPTVAGTTEVKYTATDARKKTASLTFRITVIAPLTFAPDTVADQEFPVDTPITPLTLPAAKGGTSPYTYRFSPIPDGLSFDAAEHTLSGTPTTVGTTTTTYTATDAANVSTSLTFTIEVSAVLDVNGDGQVTVVDLAIVALFYGTQVPVDISLPADVNADGIVDILDLTAVAQGVDAAGGVNGLAPQEAEAALLAAVELAAALEVVAGAPVSFGATRRGVLSDGIAAKNIAAALADVRQMRVDDVRLGKGVAVLEGILQLLAEVIAIPESTALLPNYPNPFNPETWIPYHLATDADVTLTIYDIRGSVVRMLSLGHQPAGVYESRRRAAYWDGKNQIGEPVASGVYFYTLTAGEFTATRKLLIAK